MRGCASICAGWGTSEPIQADPTRRLGSLLDVAAMPSRKQDQVYSMGAVELLLVYGAVY